MNESITIPQPRARASDPQTSRDAAASVMELRDKQNWVLVAMRLAGPCTQEELVEFYHGMNSPAPRQSDSGIRTRCHELVELGLVRNTGEKRKMSTGRMAIVWGCV